MAEFYNNAWGDHLDDITMFKNLIRAICLQIALPCALLVAVGVSKAFF